MDDRHRMSESRRDADELAIELALSTLGNPRRRAVVRSLATCPSPITTDDLAATVADHQGESDETQMRVDLEHTHLPALAESGVLEYDPRTSTVARVHRETIRRILTATIEAFDDVRRHYDD